MVYGYPAIPHILSDSPLGLVLLTAILSPLSMFINSIRGVAALGG